MINKIDWPQDQGGKIYDAGSSGAHCAMSAKCWTGKLLQLYRTKHQKCWLHSRQTRLWRGQSAFKIQPKVSLCLLATHYTHIIKLLGCRGVKTGTSGWPHLRASATLYQPSGSKKKKWEAFRGNWTIKSHCPIDIYNKQSPTIHLFISATTTQE